MADAIGDLVASAADATLGRLGLATDQPALDAAAHDGLAELVRRLAFGLEPGADALGAAVGDIDPDRLAQEPLARAWAWITVSRRVERRCGRRHARELDARRGAPRAHACPAPDALAAHAVGLGLRAPAATGAEPPPPADPDLAARGSRDASGARDALDAHLATCTSCRGAALTAAAPCAPVSEAILLAAARLRLRAREGRVGGTERPIDCADDGDGHVGATGARARAGSGRSGSSGRSARSRAWIDQATAIRLSAAAALLLACYVAGARTEEVRGDESPRAETSAPAPAGPLPLRAAGPLPPASSDSPSPAAGSWPGEPDPAPGPLRAGPRPLPADGEADVGGGLGR